MITNKKIIEEAFNEINIKCIFREKNEDQWIEVTNSFEYMPIDYLNSNIEYLNEYNDKNYDEIFDCSCILFSDNKPIALWPLTIGNKNKNICLTSQDSYVLPPILNINCPKKTSKRVHKQAFYGDTDIDVLSASSADNTIRWYENKGVDGFTCIDVIFRNAESASSVITANMDGDEDIDVLSASYSDNSILWYENDGTGKFTNEQGDYMANIIDSNAGGARAVAVADMDGDKDIDVLSASYTDGTIRWYENKGAEGFIAYTIDDNAPGANTIAAADFDNDGNMDVVAGIYNAAEIRWYENNKEALNMQRVLPQSIALHPNPMTNVLHISYISTTTVNYTLYDSTGKQLSSQIHTGKEHQLEVSHLASGTYLLKANNDMQFKYYRFMKE